MFKLVTKRSKYAFHGICYVYHKSKGGGYLFCKNLGVTFISLYLKGGWGYFLKFFMYIVAMVVSLMTSPINNNDFLKTHNHKGISILDEQNLVLHTNQICSGNLIVPGWGK